MTDKDPKDMTVSEQLRWAANGEPYNGIDENIWTYPTGKIRALAEAVTGEWPSDNEIFSIVADKIDAELAQARRSGLERAAKSWAKANGWPDFREGEDFGAWLERCTYKKPVDDCNEPVQFGDDIELHYSGGGVDKGLFQEVAINKGPVSILSFVGVSHARDYRYDSECDVLKRPAPEALGADGLPIKVGETVWSIHGIHEGIVKALNVNMAHVEWSDGRWSPSILCDKLTHTPPDTQEKIGNDATMPPAEYCAVRGIDLGDDPDMATATEAMVRDLLRRQREYDKRKGGK